MLRKFFVIPRLVMGFILLGLCMGTSSRLYAEEAAHGSLQERSTDLQIGWVDAVSENEVVINDMASSLDSITLYDQHGFLLDKRSLAAGQYVAYDRREERTEIHLLDESKRRRTSADLDSTGGRVDTKKEVVRQVDGVWKN